MQTTKITFDDVLEAVGSERADEVAFDIVSIHRGMAAHEFKQHTGGIDISGCSEVAQAKIMGLLGKKSDKKDGK